MAAFSRLRLITSQIDTAPKQSERFGVWSDGLITSQIDTAPKLHRDEVRKDGCLITSQIDTAPKQFYCLRS